MVGAVAALTTAVVAAAEAAQRRRLEEEVEPEEEEPVVEPGEEESTHKYLVGVLVSVRHVEPDTEPLEAGTPEQVSPENVD